MTADSFKQELLGARTFCLEEEVAQLRAQGFGKGANYENTLVLGASGVIENKLRFKNEFVRHKILDLIGDLYVLGRPIAGHIVALKSGHSLNFQLVKRIMEQQKTRLSKTWLIVPGKGLDINQIMKILPHREPFLFVDRILRDGTGQARRRHQERYHERLFLPRAFPVKAGHAGRYHPRGNGAGGRGYAACQSRKIRASSRSSCLSITQSSEKPSFPGINWCSRSLRLKIKSKTSQVYGKASVDGTVVAEADLMFAFDESTT